MALSNVATANDLSREPAAAIYTDAVRTVGSTSAVSWGAVLAGAAAAAALSLILLLLGVGLGLSAISPWSYEGVSGTTIGVSTIVWITFTQLAASGMGGYLAGRLRTKWVSVHTDEVYFRDTAHGFLAWAVASLATAAMLTSAVGSIVGGTVQAGAAAAGGLAGTAAAGTAAVAAKSGPAGARSEGDLAGGNSMGYFVDSLFRRDVNAPPVASVTTTTLPAASSTVPGGYAAAPGATAGTSAEINRIFFSSLQVGALPADDVRYVGQVVAQRTGLSQQEAEKRVSDTYARMQLKLREAEAAAKEAADKARKASAYAALWLFISMLIGAFVASFSATYGGRRRDL
ncbi:MAG: hypothetical protein ABI905_09095 [Betaproteobacteria bacterium]